ncbi:MAG: lipid-binding SYLF domain-containing protein [Burkholderiaceae bacterium]|nr:lipid-binding SYLF domain-containing protein [Burkholderiaceae bacterium]
MEALVLAATGAGLQSGRAFCIVDGSVPSAGMAPEILVNCFQEIAMSVRIHRRRWICASLAAGAVAIGACTTPATRSDTSELVRSAQSTLASFEADPEMQWLRDNLKRARGVLISPRMVRAGFFLGGAGGEALLLVRDGNRWVGPAFYNVGVGSVGLQVGGDVSEVIALVMTERAVDGLLSRSIKLGGDASVTAGPKGKGTGQDVTSDLVTFARSRGAFVGVSLDGAVISPDTEANAAFYGRSASPSDILVRHTVQSPAAAPLQRSLSRLAG